jgi:hypothetical protein
MNNQTSFLARTVRGPLALLLSLIALTPSATGQALSYRALTVQDPRPVMKAAEILGLRHGIVIHYEDPTYVFAGDMTDASDLAFLAANPGKQHLIPKGGRLDVEYPESQRALIRGNAALSLSEASILLQAVVNANDKRALPGSFLARQSGAAFLILPSSVKGANGMQQPTISPLDVKVTFPEQERNMAAFVELLCQQISRSGTKVVIGTIPLGFMMNTVATVKAEGEPARDVLLRALQSMHWQDASLNHPIGKLCWRLLYDIDNRRHVLNLVGAVKEVGTPAGGVQVEPI